MTDDRRRLKSPRLLESWAASERMKDAGSWDYGRSDIPKSTGPALIPAGHVPLSHIQARLFDRAAKTFDLPSAISSFGEEGARALLCWLLARTLASGVAPVVVVESGQLFDVPTTAWSETIFADQRRRDLGNAIRSIVRDRLVGDEFDDYAGRYAFVATENEGKLIDATLALALSISSDDGSMVYGIAEHRVVVDKEGFDLEDAAQAAQKSPTRLLRQPSVQRRLAWEITEQSKPLSKSNVLDALEKLGKSIGWSFDRSSYRRAVNLCWDEANGSFPNEPF